MKIVSQEIDYGTKAGALLRKQIKIHVMRVSGGLPSRRTRRIFGVRSLVIKKRLFINQK